MNGQTPPDMHLVQGTTRIATIVGHPVVQVKLPGLLNRHLQQQGADVAMVPVDVPPEGLAAFFRLMRHGRNLIGSVLTIPHKQAAVAHLDVLSDRARALGAVNVVRRANDGTLHGDHVDGFSFLAAARAHGFHPRGRSAVVVGIGGAGSAIAYALCEIGVARLCLLGRNAERTRAFGAKLQAWFPAVSLAYVCTDLAGVDFLAQATPVGMRAGDPLPLPAALLDTLRAETLVADVITAPAVTPLLELAQARGCRTQAGVEMARASMAFLGGILGLMPAVDPAAFVAAPLPSSTI
ncbi:MAG: hypothetical protein JWP29_4794 [Rhodoferax sp.]|nr:hypothetical protein [Rhodoferax sp.]